MDQATLDLHCYYLECSRGGIDIAAYRDPNGPRQPEDMESYALAWFADTDYYEDTEALRVALKGMTWDDVRHRAAVETDHPVEGDAS